MPHAVARVMARPHALGTGRLGRDLLPLALVEQTFRKPTPSVHSCSERERRGPQPAHKGTGRRPSVRLRTEPVSQREDAEESTTDTRQGVPKAVSECVPQTETSELGCPNAAPGKEGDPRSCS